MQNEAETNGDGFVEDLIQPDVQHAEPLPKPKSEFRPWHKPRKHWIRRNQWGAETGDLIGKLGLQGKHRPLNYISLPGPDMLDVRALHRACAEAGAEFQFLGFMTGNASEKTELNISLDEVLSLPGVSSQSEVILDPLQSLADPKSVGYSKAEQYAPFDVINIDLCNSLGNAPPLNEQRGCYNALQRIIELQRQKRPPDQPWLLFLTTRSDPGSVNDEARGRFFDCLIRNIEQHDAIVRPAVLEGLGLTLEQLVSLRDGAPQDGTAFEPAFAAAVGKWLLQLLGAAPAGTLTLLPSSCFYDVHTANDMISLGFLCQTIIAPAMDPAGLAAPGGHQGTGLTEPEAAAAMIRLMPQIRNVDDVLRNTDGAYALAVEEAAAFMGTARFDEAQYRNWAQDSKEAPQAAQAVG